jgi:uncharacterized membrane protein YhaH (DUF805 family)
MNFNVVKTNIEQAVRISLSKFADFSGRASRSEYWYLVLPIMIVSFILKFVDSMFFGLSILSMIFAVATVVPTVSAGVRRLHDTDRSGWWMLIILVPVVGLVIFYFLCQPGTQGQNRFGSEPSTASFGALAQA